MKEVRPEFYDEEYFNGKIKSNYDNYQETEGIFRAVAGMLVTMFRPRSVLDIGCAYGFLVKHLRYGTQVGIDVSKYAILQRRATNKVFLASATNLPFRNKIFDLVVCVETLEHISEENIQLSLHEIERVCKKWVFITSPHPTDYPDGEEKDCDISHISKKPEEDWIKMGKDIGWFYDKKNVEYAKTFPVVKTYGWQVMIFDMEA